MSKLHITTKPRLAMKMEDGVLVPSKNLQGKQDVQVAGLVTSLNANEEHSKSTGNSYYRGTAKIFMNGKEKEVSVIFTGGEDDNGNARIAKIEIGSTFWLTMRPSEDGARINFNCGGLRVVDEVSTNDFDALYALAGKLAQSEGADENADTEEGDKPADVQTATSTKRVKLAGADDTDEQEEEESDEPF